jgi:hypothetical protein
MVGGDAELPGTDTLFSLVYDELKRLARRHRRSVGAGSTLCTTELVQLEEIRELEAALDKLNAVAP